MLKTISQNKLNDIERKYFGCTLSEYMEFNSIWNTIECEDKYRFRLMNVNPLRQAVILELIKSIEGADYIHKLFLFGSTVTCHCTKDSDLDLAVEFKTECNKKRSLY